MLVVVVVVVDVVVIGSLLLLLCRCRGAYALALALALVHAPLQLAQHEPDSRHFSSQQDALLALLARLVAHASMLSVMACLLAFAHALAFDVASSDLQSLPWNSGNLRQLVYAHRGMESRGKNRQWNCQFACL